MRHADTLLGPGARDYGVTVFRDRGPRPRVCRRCMRFSRERDPPYVRATAKASSKQMPNIDWAEFDEAVNIGLSGTAAIWFDQEKGTFEQAEFGSDSGSTARRRIARHAMCTGRRAQILLVHALGNLAVRNRVSRAANQLWQTSALDRGRYRAAWGEHFKALKDAGISIRDVEADGLGLRADIWSWLEASSAFEKGVTLEWQAYLRSRVATRTLSPFARALPKCGELGVVHLEHELDRRSRHGGVRVGHDQARAKCRQECDHREVRAAR